jgi:hypothetical protein
MTRCTLARVPFSQGAASFYSQVRAISKPSTERRTSVSGVAILACAIWIGPRERFPQTTQRPNNLATNRTTHLSLNMAAQFVRLCDFVKRFNRAASPSNEHAATIFMLASFSVRWRRCRAR